MPVNTARPITVSSETSSTACDATSFGKNGHTIQTGQLPVEFRSLHEGLFCEWRYYLSGCIDASLFSSHDWTGQETWLGQTLDILSHPPGFLSAAAMTAKMGRGSS